MSETARETAQGIWDEWANHATAQSSQLVDAITAALEERNREIERLKAEQSIVSGQRDAAVKAEASMRVLKESQQKMISDVWKTHGEQFAQLTVERDTLKELLREAVGCMQPFAALANSQTALALLAVDSTRISSRTDASVTIGDCRRVAALLARPEIAAFTREAATATTDPNCTGHPR